MLFSESSGRKRYGINPEEPARFSGAHSVSVHGNPNSLPRILGLLVSRKPLAVLFAVISVYILSLNGMSLGANSHIFNEYLKFPKPSFVNGNTSPAIMGKGCIVGISASIFHGVPYSIGQTKGVRSGLSVSIERPSKPRASTAFNHTSFEVAVLHSFFRPATASSENVSASGRWRNTDDSVLMVSLSDDFITQCRSNHIVSNNQNIDFDKHYVM